jgi:hypothetical protein
MPTSKKSQNHQTHSGPAGCGQSHWIVSAALPYLEEGNFTIGATWDQITRLFRSDFSAISSGSTDAGAKTGHKLWTAPPPVSRLPLERTFKRLPMRSGFEPERTCNNEEGGH